jgi:hypothetical protein
MTLGGTDVHTRTVVCPSGLNKVTSTYTFTLGPGGVWDPSRSKYKTLPLGEAVTLSPEQAKNIKWFGLKLEYKITYWLDNNGNWGLSCPAAGINQSGKGVKLVDLPSLPAAASQTLTAP